MKIQKRTRIDEQLTEQLAELELKCNLYDDIESSACIDMSLNYYKDMNSMFLLYEDDILVSFITIFAPLKHEMEICGFTDPDFRQKGYFRLLLNEVIKEAKLYTINDILFVFDGKFINSNLIATGLNAKLDQTEYYLSYNFNKDDCKNIASTVVIKEVVNSNELPLVVDLEKEIFKEDEGVALALSKSVLVSNNRAQYIGYNEKKAIGLINVETNKNQAIIFGFGILKKYRGKGLAKDMLCILIQELKKHKVKKISLEVDSKNPKALALYISCGFEKEKFYEYYRLELDSFKEN